MKIFFISKYRAYVTEFQKYAKIRAVIFSGKSTVYILSLKKDSVKFQPKIQSVFKDSIILNTFNSFDYMKVTLCLVLESI